MAEDKHLYLVDGSGYIFRAYHKLPPLTDPAGTPVGAVYGFTTMLLKLQQDLNDQEHPTHLAVIFDAARKTFRSDIYPAYKTNRPPPPEDLVPQFPLTRDAVRALGIPCVESPGFEADDIIASYAEEAKRHGWKVTIVSSDKDLMQLVGDGVDLFDSMNNRHLDAAAVRQKFGVPPDQVIDVQALMGDAIDNVPGVPGIGPKTAAQLIETYGDLETLLAHASEIKQPKRRESLIAFADQARLSKQLVTLRRDVDLPVPLDAMAICLPPPAPLLAFLEKHGFRSLKAKLAAGLGNGGAGTEGLAKGAPPQGDAADYQCVTSEAALAAWVARIKEAGVVAVDTETTGLDAMVCDLVGISLACEAGEACYIPVGHRAPGEGGLALEGDAPRQLPLAAVLAALRPLLADPAILKIGQNIKYDMEVLARYGVAVTPIDDTMLMSYALDSGKNGHGMDELAALHLGYKTIRFAEVAGAGRNQVTFDHVPLDKATAYAAEDADITLRLSRILKPRLAKEGVATVYETLERPLVPVLAAMERHGVKIDRAALARLSGEFAQRMTTLEKEIHALAGEAFNIASPAQLGEVLFDKLDISPKPKKTKTGAWATGADILEELADLGHDLPARVLDWRQLAKLKSTYTDTLQGQINPATGRVHTSYHMAATSTGRLSSNDPNLQNIPVRSEEGRRIRQAFIADDGCALISADYSQIELRLLAHIADIAALKKAFREGEDIHALTASQVFGVPLKDMDPMIRRQAKAINFGIIYGISAFGLARQLGIARAEAQRFIDAYFDRFPGIRRYMDETVEQARRQGYVETLFGRRVHIRGINDKNPNMRGFSERAAINAPIQGAAADIIRRAMIRMPAALAEAGLGAVRMLMQVHDELVFEAPAALVEEACPVIATVMSQAATPAHDLSVPLVVETGHGANWDAAH
ncbi:MAG: DNA polymerase I [Pseudomonadota bacterium]